MKVIKRDGRAVDYNREKIEIAIEKANKEYRVFRVKQDQEYVSEFDREVEKYLKGEK